MTAQHELLTRDQFRQAVFERDHHRCVLCGEPNPEAFSRQELVAALIYKSRTVMES
jgi:5-methylcytosine-specific restriction endonuclease McrA